MNFIEIFYGKYLDQIDNEIPSEHIILNQSGSFTRSLEPGEPNFPSQQTYSFTLRNVDFNGNFLYPYEFWESNSRSESEGATQELQIYFRIKVSGIDNFVGILKSLKYGERDSTVSITLGDLLDLVRQDTRKMLRSFKFEGLSPLDIDTHSTGINDLPALQDINGNSLSHECMRFRIGISAITPIYFDDTAPDYLKSRLLQNSYTQHIGIQETRTWPPNSSPPGQYIVNEITRNAFVQIGNITLFTRIRLTLQLNISLGPFYYEELFLDIWHSAEPIAPILPRGRFFFNDREAITLASEGMEIIIHEPSFGYDSNTAVYDAYLPFYEDFIFGFPFIYSGSNIRLSNSSYGFFDVVDAVKKIVDTSISLLHTLQELRGSLTITSGATSAASPVAATGEITIPDAPTTNEYVYLRFSKIGEIDSVASAVTLLESTDTADQAAQKIETAINSGQSSAYFTGSRTTNYVDIEFNTTGEIGNNWYIELFRSDTPYIPNEALRPLSVTPLYERPTSGGSDGGFSTDGIEILIGNKLIATTTDITESESATSIANKIFSALTATDEPYQYQINGNKVDVISQTGKVQGIRLNVFDTGVNYTTEAIQGNYDVFKERTIPGLNRKAFVSDLVMYGWATQSLAQALVAIAWQTSSYLYTDAEGDIVIQSRRFLDTDPELIDVFDEDMEPIGGSSFQEGFRSFSTEIPIDIIEVNNLVSPERTTIIADKNGLREKPSLKNKNIRLANFRITDLGVPAIGNPNNEKVLRISPADPTFPEDISDFLPTPQTQLINISQTLYFPRIERTYKLYYPEYEDLDVGEFILDSNYDVWLIRDVNVFPTSQEIQIVVSFEKNITPQT